MCGGTAPTLRGEYGILYSCVLPKNPPGGFAVCTFSQECSLGCQTRGSNNGSFQDMCGADQVVPVTLDPKYVVGGSVVNGTLHLSAPAASLTSAQVENDGGVLLTTPVGFFPMETANPLAEHTFR